MTAWFRHVAAAARLEIQQVLTHPVEWLTAILAPLFWCAVLWFAFSAGTLSGLPVALVDLDQSAASRSVAQALDALPSIKLEQFENSLSADRALKNSKVFAVVTIPQDFETDRRRGAGAPVSIDINKSWYAVGTLLEVDFKTALSTLAIGHAAVNATTQGGTFAENSRHLRITTPDVYFLGNPAFNFVAYLLPTFIPGILALGALLAFISMLSREWRAGGIRRFMKLTQGSGSAVLAGKLLPWVIVFCTASSLWVAAFAGAAGWGAEGPIIFWLTASWLLILAMAGLAALVVSIAPTWVIALSAGICLIAPTFPFTGFSFPLDSMTPGAQLFGSLLPLTHYLQAQAQIWVLGSPLSAIAQTQLTLAAFPIILFAAAGPLFARRMRRLKKTEQMSSDLTAALEKSLEAHPAASGERTGFWKSFALTVRSAFLSRDTIAIFGGAVAFYLVFYGWPYSTQQIENVPVEIVDLDGSSASRRLIEAIDAAPAAALLSVSSDPGPAMETFRSKGQTVVVTIPHGYAEHLARGENTTLHILGSAAYPVKTRAIQAAVSAAAADAELKIDQASSQTPGIPPASLLASANTAPQMQFQYRFNEISGYGNYTVPAVGPIILQAVMLMGIGMSLGGWLWRHPRRKFVCDAVDRPWNEGLGIAFGLWLIAFGWFLYMEGFGFWFGQYGAMATPWGVVLTGACYAAAVVGFGFMIVTLIRSNCWTAPVTVVMSAPALFISGAVWPTANLHPAVAALAELIPSTHAIRASVAAAQDGALFADILPHCLFLLVLSVVYGLFGLLNLKVIPENPRELAANDVV